MIVQTSLRVDNSPASEDQQKARITLDDGTVINVRSHTTYWNPRIIVTKIEAKGASLEAFNLWLFEQEVNNHQRLVEGWRNFAQDHVHTELLDDWLKEQIQQAINEEGSVQRVCSDGAGNDTIYKDQRLVIHDLFGSSQTHLGTVTKIEIIA